MASKEDDITAPQELLEYAPTLPAITLTPLSTTPGIRRSISNSSSNPGLSRTPSPSSPSSSIDTAISSPTSVSCRPSESWSSFYYTWKDSYDASRLMPPPLSYYTRNASSTLSGETTNAGGNNAFDSFQSLRISDMSHYSHPINSPPREEHVLKCDECSRSFRKDIHLERHLRIHSKAKPFTCSGCDKGFSRKDHLKSHVRLKACGERKEVFSSDSRHDISMAEVTKAVDMEDGLDPHISHSAEDLNSLRVEYNNIPRGRQRLGGQTNLTGELVQTPKKEEVTLPTDIRFIDQNYETDLLQLKKEYDFYNHYLIQPFLQPHKNDRSKDPDASLAQTRMDFLSHTFSEPENKVAEVNEYDRTVSPTPPSDSSSVVTGGYVDERKGQIIDSVVHAVTLWLRSRFIFAHQATSHTEEVPQSEGGQSTKSEQRQSSSHPDQSKKRKLADRGDGDGGGGEEDGNEDDRNPYHIDNTDSKGKRRELAKFACPYFKYNPAKYKEWRICPGPGWPDVHRVKEHLYRRHRQPAHRCGRCWQPFEDEQDYLNHQRTAEPCSLREKEPTEGFDASQEKKLKSRKKVANEMGEVAKWQAVFSILFPHVSKEDIPSPFYDYDQFGNIMGPSSQNYLTECEEYVLREVPPRLRQILRPELDRDLNIIEESLKIRAINCVKTLLTETFREFRQVHQQRMTPEVNNESTSLAGDAGPSSMQPPAAIGLEDYDLDHPEQDSFAGFDAGLDFFDMSALANLEASLAEGVLMEDILQPSIENTEQKQSDSGYESNIVERPSRDLSE